MREVQRRAAEEVQEGPEERRVQAGQTALRREEPEADSVLAEQWGALLAPEALAFLAMLVAAPKGHRKNWEPAGV